MNTSDELHPLASKHLPSFIVGPGQTDLLFVFAVVFLLAAVFAVGVLYMRLHALPEHLAHRTQKIQYEIVALLALVALFTHSRPLWIAALVLAVIDLPDFLSPLRSMAISLGKMTQALGRVPAPIAATAETGATNAPVKDEEVKMSPPEPERVDSVVGQSTMAVETSTKENDKALGRGAN